MTRLLNNRYEILSVIGRGGMGCVYKAADRLRAGKAVAVKELRTDRLSPEKVREALAQFQTEARILARLTHPNLPRVFDYFSLPGRSCLVMEYIAGRTLEEILAALRGKPVDERTALAWALQICRAMHFLAVQKPRPVVFRDLKPSNIMIAKDGRVKLIDFGIARFFKEDKTEDTFVYGTPGYAAPEQYGSGQTDVRSDIFSLGATLHHCLTGRNPSENPLDFPDPETLNPKLHKGTARIVRKALEQEMSRRYQSALDMKRVIQGALLTIASLPKGAAGVIHAEAGRPVRLPWWQKTSWVSVPVMALGCSGTTGTLSSGDRWLKPRPGAFGPDTALLLFRVESGTLRPGKEYRPVVTIRTDAGVVRPRLLFKRSWPWFLIAVAALAAVTAAMLMMRLNQ